LHLSLPNQSFEEKSELMAKILIIIGLLLLLAGIILYFFPNAFHWIGRLPGDINYSSGNTSFHFPLMTSILASILISLLFWILKR
jgi:hypothetical protein